MSEPWPGCPGVLLLVTEPSPRLPEIVRAAIAGGVDVVYYRDKSASEQLLQVNEDMGPSTLLLTGLQLGVSRIGDGVHLSENDMPVNAAREKLEAGTVIGRSIHSVGSARKAEKEGADYLVAGTIFASKSHPEIAPAGIGFLREVCCAVTVPVVAIGGITPERVGECIAAGAAGVAVLSPIMRAVDPQAVARTYREALDTAWKQWNE